MRRSGRDLALGALLLFVPACLSAKKFTVEDGGGDAGDGASEPEVAAPEPEDDGAGPDGDAPCAGAGDCDDGDACTEDLCDEAAGCLHVVLDCADGDACTADVCVKGQGCAHDPIVCDDGLDCTGVETCSPIAGCLPGKPESGCCASDQHCDDGNPCNGAGQCQLATGTCLLVAAPKCDDGKPCNGVETCNPVVAGGCVAGAPLECGDGNLCNGVEACDDAKGCDAGVPLDCDDGLPCNGLESCDPETGCVVGAALPGCCKSAAECEDGNPCNGLGNCDLDTETCAVTPPEKCDDGNVCDGTEPCLPASGCVAGTPIACGDGNLCNGVEGCDPEIGCVTTGEPNVCGDGNACNGLESCDPKAGCVPGKPPACEDGNPCNGVATCDTTLGCIGGALSPCSDGNPCNGQEACDPALGCTPGTPLACKDADACNGLETCDATTGCKPGSAPDCDDSDACTDDACTAGAGCTHDPVSCDDGLPCTVDTCQKATGCASTAGACDDGNPCTDDLCDPDEGCLATPNDATCDDGDACTAADSCADGDCAGGRSIVCDDGEPCTGDSCDPETGCDHAPLEDPCDDGDACTSGDSCADGACAGGNSVVCDDGEPCTADTCDSETGCDHAPLEDPCDDGDACTAADSCAGGACAGGPSIVCDDAEPCTTDACDSASGCTHDPVAGAPSCDDGDACTSGDSCADGACTGGNSVVCDDGNPCTDDGCSPETGCLHEPLDGGEPCKDEDPCTDGETCSKGACIEGYPETCVDENVCTDDSCVPFVGCHFEPNSLPCLDGDSCSKDDVCGGGECLPGPEIDCDDGDACSVDACNPANGTCSHVPDPTVVTCDDGDACTANESCAAGACDGGDVIVCDDENPCTDEACDADLGCESSPNVEPCDDGSPCTGSDLCAGGECEGGPAAFDRTYGGEGEDQGFALAVLPDGGFALCGRTDSKGAGDYDAWLVRTDGAGEPLWDRTYGGGSADHGQDLSALPGGGFALAGFTSSKGAGGDDFWLVRTDGDGEPLWEQTYGGAAFEAAYAIAAVPGGGFALAGYTLSKGAGGEDMWLVLTDAEGDVVWDATFGGEMDERAFDVVAPPAGGLALAGHTFSGGAGSADLRLVRTDADGGLLWERTFGGASYDEAQAIAALPDGGFALAGLNVSTSGTQDLWLVRTDAEGALLWDETFGGGGGEYAFSLAALGDGGFALAGYTSSKGAGDYDVWLVRTDAAGALLWDRTFGGAETDDVRGLAALPGGGFAIAGYSDSTGAGAYDLWLVVTSDGAPCGDGEPCNGAEECSDGACSVTVPAACDDDNDCTADSCEPGTGCVHEIQDGDACDDGDACTVSDACAAGECASGNPVACDDGNSCTGPDVCAGGDCEYPALGFDVPFGGASLDRGHDLVALPGGGYAVAGFTLSKGAGGLDGWLVRVDAAGGALWDRTYGGAGGDEARAMAALPNGGFALAGYTGSQGAGGNDVWLVRADGAGDLLGERTFGGASNDLAEDLAALADGGFALAGQTESKGAGGRDAWLVRTDAEGEPIWDRSFGGAGTDDAQALVALADGGFALAGQTDSKGAGGFDAWLVRTNGAGEPVWDRTYGGIGYDAALSLAALPDGGFAFGGEIDEGEGGGLDVRLIRTDASGEIVWEETYGGAGNEEAFDLALAPGGGFVLAGYTTSKGAGFADLWVVRTDGEGIARWDRTFGGIYDDAAGALAALPGGGYAMAGHTYSKGAGNLDLWLVVTSDGAPCDGGESCADAAECLEGACSVPTPSPCDDGNPCTADACDAGSGDCTHTPDDGAPCDDGSPCTDGDSCAGGGCVGGTTGFDVTFGTVGADVAHAIAVLPDGSFALAGFKGTGAIDMWLVRTDAGGEALWDRTFGGEGTDIAYALSSVSGGGFVLGGLTGSKGAGNLDFWLVRTDAQGNLTWDRTYGGAENDEAYGLVSLSDEGFALAGRTLSKGAGGYDAWLVRTDSLGEPLWDATYGYSGGEGAQAVSSLPDGGFVLAGSTTSKGAGGVDLWLVRTDAEGGPIWDRTFGNTGNQIANAVVLLPDGGFALAGETPSKGAAGLDFWLVRTDSDGALLWDRTYGAGNDVVHALATLPDGGFALAGYTDSKGVGEGDAWLVRADATGELLWDRTFGGVSADEAHGLAVDSNGGFVLAGTTKSKGEGVNDFWLVVTTDGSSCTDGDSCNGQEECHTGACAAPDPDPCDDGNDCTLDSCDPASGCANEPGGDGTPCDDGSPCTGAGTCDAGACEAPAAGFDLPYGGGARDEGRAVAALSDGGFAVAGWTQSKGAGDDDLWVVRTDSSGAVVWDETFGGEWGEAAYGIAALEDGGLALAGHDSSKDPGNFDAWLVRTDALGGLVWDQTFGGGAEDGFRAVDAAADGGFAAAGHTKSKGSGGLDMWLVRTDSEGVLLWEGVFGGASNDAAVAVVALEDGGFALAGRTASKGAGDVDAWLVRTDADGVLVWDRTYGGFSSDEGRALVVLPDGYALAGYTYSKGGGGSDAWLVRTDASGQQLWDKAYGGAFDDTAFALVRLTDGGFALAGFESATGESSSVDAWLVRTDADGEPLWDRTFGGATNDEAHGLATVAGGGLALVGFTQSKGAGSADLWLVVTSDGTPCGDPGSVCAGTEECLEGACLEVAPGTCE